MSFNGITTIFNEKKWVFSYIVMFSSYIRFDDAGYMQILSILIPSVFALAAADKYTKRNPQ